jgi:hypothetical protein
MLDVKDAIRSRYRREIQQKQREASALSIEVYLDAETETDVIALAEASLTLDTAIGLLDEAKAKLRQSAGTTPSTVPSISSEKADPLFSPLTD